MGMLDRIKKRQYDGFRDFVESLEVTSQSGRVQIMLNGMLEDPIFMQWVVRNIKTFGHLLELPADNICAVLKTSDSVVTLFAKALPDEIKDNPNELMGQLGSLGHKVLEELSFKREVTSGEREAAQFFILKNVRKLQREELITGLPWQLPPLNVFYPAEAPPEGKWKISFEGGVLAAEGEVLKSKRIGQWRHFYEQGQLLAEGSYVNGIKSGGWIFYYSTGDKRSEGRFRDDVRHGMWKEWDRSGKMTESEWIEGKKKD